MAIQKFYDALILYKDYDASADHNQVKLEQKIDMLEYTKFGDVNKTYLAGLRGLNIEGDGYLQWDDSSTPKTVDYQFEQLVATQFAGAPFTIAETRGDGSFCYLGKAFGSNFSRDLVRAELPMFNFKLDVNEKFARGVVALPLSQRSGASGNGTTGQAWNQLGALSATQKLIASFHVTQFNGTTLSLVVNSNDTNNTTTPTARITKSGITGVFSSFDEVSGPITDQYWYVSWTFTGTNFTAAVSIGIK